jgi:hypothetical protein
MYVQRLARVVQFLARARVGLALLGVFAAGCRGGFGHSESALGGPSLVISQLYAGGGNSGANVHDDFVELYNRGNSDVDIANWSLQYAPPAMTGKFAVAFLSPTKASRIVPAGDYFLVQFASGGNNGKPLGDILAPNLMRSNNLGVAGGKLALVDNSTALTCGATAGSCSAVSDVIDFLGWGTATDYESAAAPGLDSNGVLQRHDSGATDSNNNANDFSVLEINVGASNLVLHRLADPDMATPPDMTQIPVDMTPPPDMTQLRDMTPPPDMAQIPDLAGVDMTPLPDMTRIPDMTTPPDMTQISDLAGADMTFFADMTPPRDMTPELDLSIPLDMTPPPDLAAPRDLTTVRDLTMPPPPPRDLATVHDLASSMTGAGDVVISQLYGAGGTSGAKYNHDFIELFNRGTMPVLIGNWSVQYGSAANNFSQHDTIPAGTVIMPGQYFLVQASTTNASVGAALPVTPDFVSANPMLNFSATNGKVALVDDVTVLACGSAAMRCNSMAISDLLGYGTAADFETKAAVTPGGSTKALFRAGAGCVDTNNNSSDFTAGDVMPRNSASAIVSCATSAGAIDMAMGSAPDLAGSGSSDDFGTSGGSGADLSAGTGPGTWDWHGSNGIKGRGCSVVPAPADSSAPSLLLMLCLSLLLLRARLRRR